jgi:hypothetical protein
MRKFDMFITLNASVEISEEEYQEFIENTKEFIEKELKNNSNRVTLNFVQNVGVRENK